MTLFHNIRNLLNPDLTPVTNENSVGAPMVGTLKRISNGVVA